MYSKSLTSFLALFLFATMPAFATATDGTEMPDARTAVSAALAADVDSVKEAAKELAATASDAQLELAKKAKGVASSDSLEKAREKFDPLSEDAVKLAEGKEGYFVMTCPMTAGDWIQKEWLPYDRECGDPE
jgi:hypothetical protein